MRAVLLLLKYGDFEGRGQPVPLKQLVRKIAVPAFVTAQDQLSAGSAAVQFRQAVEDVLHVSPDLPLNSREAWQRQTGMFIDQ